MKPQSSKQPTQKAARFRRVGFLIYPDCEILDVCSPFEAFYFADMMLGLLARTKEPCYQSLVLAAAPGPIRTMSGMEITATHRYSDIADGLYAVDRTKDIDGMNSAMIGLLALKEPGYNPCTAEGIVELLKRSGIPVKGRHCVVIGRGPTAGIPSMLALLNAGDASVSCCHTGTPREVLLPQLDQAEIVVIALREPDKRLNSLPPDS